MRLTLIAALCAIAGGAWAQAQADAAPGAIRLNSIGYLPAAQKLAVLAEGAGARF